MAKETMSPEMVEKAQRLSLVLTEDYDRLREEHKELVVALRGYVLRTQFCGCSPNVEEVHARQLLARVRGG